MKFSPPVRIFKPVNCINVKKISLFLTENWMLLEREEKQGLINYVIHLMWLGYPYEKLPHRFQLFWKVAKAAIVIQKHKLQWIPGEIRRNKKFIEYRKDLDCQENLTTRNFMDRLYKIRNGGAFLQYADYFRLINEPVPGYKGQLPCTVDRFLKLYIDPKQSEITDYTISALKKKIESTLYTKKRKQDDEKKSIKWQAQKDNKKP